MKRQTKGVPPYRGPVMPSAGYSWMVIRLRRAFGTPLGEFLSTLSLEDQEVVLNALWKDRFYPADVEGL